MAEELERNHIASLDLKRKAIETEGAAIISELEAPTEDGGPCMGIDTPLVDAQGYPRGDVDVVRARTLRSRLNIIRTDHKVLMKEMDEALKRLASLQDPKKSQKEREELEKRMAPKPTPKFDRKTGKWVVMNWDGTVSGVPGGDQRQFDDLDNDKGAVQSEERVSKTAEKDHAITTPTTVTQQEKSTPLLPFARINFVAEESPAAEACMEENDLILDFGGINHTNPNTMGAIEELVPRAASSQEELEVRILRDGSQLFLRLKPRSWFGRGLLGCHIVKYSQE